MIGITERGDSGRDFSWKKWVIEEGKPAILITKNPELLQPELSGTENIIIHCTITGFGGTILEPGVRKPEVTLPAYRELVEKFGGERVVLRVDPIIDSPKGMCTAENILRSAISRIRVSFLDMYPHVIERFKKVGLPLPHSTLHAPIMNRKKIVEIFQRSYELEICGEPGFECTGCVSQADLDVLLPGTSSNKLGNQRQSCACLSLKKELLSNKKQCKNACLYCYWK